MGKKSQLFNGLSFPVKLDGIPVKAVKSQGTQTQAEGLSMANQCL